MRRVRFIKKYFGFFLLIVTLIVTTACGDVSVALQRADSVNVSDNKIIIGVAWPFAKANDGFEQGLALALQEINKAGGVNGRKISLIKKDDHAEVTQGLNVAKSFAKNVQMSAVIGHRNSFVSIPVSSVYEKAGLLMLSPASTAPKLTQDNDLVFRNISSDTAVARRMAKYAKGHGLHRIVIYYTSDAYGRGLANAFEASANSLGLNVVDRITFLGDQSHLKKLEDRWRAFDFDAIFVASGMPQGAEFVKKIREGGIDVPILGGNAMNTPDLIKTAGALAEGVTVGSFFNPESDRPMVQAFVKHFKAKYGTAPTQYSALGYDALKLLARAFDNGDSAAPQDIADALHDMKHVEGVVGFHTFDQNGDDVGPLIQVKKVSNGQFVSVEGSAS